LNHQLAASLAGRGALSLTKVIIHEAELVFARAKSSVDIEAHKLRKMQHQEQLRVFLQELKPLLTAAQVSFPSKFC